MRVQYRARWSAGTVWGEWKDWSGTNNGQRAFVQTRIVDDEGNEVPQTEPFVPAFYEYVGPEADMPKYPMMLWRNGPPNQNPEDWKRRDDVKPSARP